MCTLLSTNLQAESPLLFRDFALYPTHKGFSRIIVILMDINALLADCYHNRESPRPLFRKKGQEDKEHLIEL